MAVSCDPSSTVTIHHDHQNDSDGSISSVHHDILHTHILSRLDGPTLASLSFTSSQFYSLISNDDHLWQHICRSLWPSINHPIVLSTFASGYRSFFSDCYPLLHHHCHAHNEIFPTTSELISAVDVYYQDVPIFSEIERTETLTSCFLSSPFRVDVLESKGFEATWIQKDLIMWPKQLEENITMSWILIDPKEKRAVNMSSKRAVSVQRHWLTGEVLVKFATILGGDEECEMVVTCTLGGKGEGIKVRDVSMRMEDVDGKALTGRESLVLLKGAIDCEMRRSTAALAAWKERYKEFLQRKRDRFHRGPRSVFGWICIMLLELLL